MFPVFTDLDEELPDYIMVMVANKKTSQQMADDLSLFLGNNTIKFTTWYDLNKKKVFMSCIIHGHLASLYVLTWASLVEFQAARCPGEVEICRCG